MSFLRKMRYRLLSHICTGDAKRRYKEKYKKTKMNIANSVRACLETLNIVSVNDNKCIEYYNDYISLIERIRSGTYKGIYVMGSCDMGWFEVFKQRHHHIAEHLMKNDYIVICAMNPEYELDKTETIKQVSKNLYLVNFYDKSNWMKMITRIAFESDKIFYHLIGTERYTTCNDVEYLKSIGYKIVYEYFDELSKDIFPNLSDESIKRHHMFLKDKEVLIVATAQNLYSKATAHRTENVILSKNAVCLEDWIIDEDNYTPKEMLDIVASRKKIIGFYGSFAPWIDYEYIKHLAKEMPDCNIVMIGYDYEWGKGAFAKSRISELPNVHIINSQPYNKLKYFSQFFDVAMIPFRIYEVTNSVSPVKLFEFMAQGIPVVTSDMPECRLYDSCLIAKSKEEFVEKIKYALAMKDNKDFISKLKDDAAKNTWSARGEQVLELLNANMAETNDIILSIGIPCYNMESLIDVCLRSLHIRSIFKNIEVIVVNDGSLDRSSDLVKLYNSMFENRVIIVDKENGGHGSCINAAVKVASGKYFKLVDSDDYLDSVALLQHIHFLKNCNSDAVVTNYRRFFNDGSTEEVSYAHKLIEKEYVIGDFIDELMTDDGYLSYVHMHALTYKTSILKNIKITEKSFYVDNEYIAYPVKVVNNISYQNIHLYMYYIGRPGQSVNPEIAIKRSEQNYNIIKNIINFSESLSGRLKDYVQFIVYYESYFYVQYNNDPAKESEVLSYWKKTNSKYYELLKAIK